MANIPCVGCFWNEGQRCFQDKLADLHGLEKTPRDAPLLSGRNGLEITDGLITACMDRGVHQRKSLIYGRLANHLRSVGVKVEKIGTDAVR
jgi:hypothetical protein